MQITSKRSEMGEEEAGDLWLHLQCFASFKRKSTDLKQIRQCWNVSVLGIWLLYCFLLWYFLLPLFFHEDLSISNQKRHKKQLIQKQFHLSLFIFYYICMALMEFFFFLFNKVHCFGVFNFCMRLMTLLQSTTVAC